MIDYRTRTAQYPELEDCLYLCYRQKELFNDEILYAINLIKNKYL